MIFSPLTLFIIYVLYVWNPPSHTHKNDCPRKKIVSVKVFDNSNQKWRMVSSLELDQLV